MKLPNILNYNCEYAVFDDDLSGTAVYTNEHMLQLQRDTIEACCQMLLESGFKSNGVPAYEHLVDKLRSMK